MNVQTELSMLAAKLYEIVVNNWSFFLGGISAIIAFRCFKAGIKICVSILIASILVSTLTNLGIMPPLDELLHFTKSFFW